MFSVAQAKEELIGILHGTTLDQVINITGAFNRAARKLLLDIDPQEMKVIEPLSTPVFPVIFNYIAPDDIKGNKIIDILPQIGRTPDQKISLTYNRNFDLYKSFPSVGIGTVIFNRGKKTLRISYQQNNASKLINSVGSISDNGTWSVSGSASNLVQNLMTVINGQHSLQLDLGTGSNVLSNSNMFQIDLSADANQSAIVFQLNLTSISNLSSLSFKFGSDSSNYYQSPSITSQFSTLPFVVGWNDIGSLWSNCTKVGSPDNTKIKYIEITFNTTGSIPRVQVAQIYSSLGIPMDIEFYSKYLFSDASTGEWKEKTDNDSDLINLDTESYNLFLFQLAIIAVQQSLGQVANFDISFFSDEYNEGVKRYKKMYKSELSKVQEPYYDRSFNGYNNQISSSAQNRT